MRPDELNPTEYAVLLYVINPSNWDRASEHDPTKRFWDGTRPPTAHAISLKIGRTPQRAHMIVRKLVEKGYLDANFKPTSKCNGINRNLKLKGIS